MTIKRCGSTEVLSEVVEHKGILYLAGVTAEDRSLDMAGQTKQVVNQIDRLLEAHGSNREHLLTALIFVTDIASKPAMNKVWKEWLAKDHLPARATVGISALEPGVRIEVVATAAKLK